MSAANTPAIRNEPLQLAATAFNTIGVAFVVTGAIAPAIAFGYQISAPHGRFRGAFVALWLTMGSCSHLTGRFPPDGDEIMSTLELLALAGPVLVVGLGFLYARWLIRH
jgi:hypothetical protein